MLPSSILVFVLSTFTSWLLAGCTPTAGNDATMPRLMAREPSDQQQLHKRQSIQKLSGLANSSCENIANTIGPLAWEAANGDVALDMFIDFWVNDLYYCPDCWGMKTCSSNLTACVKGTRSEAGTLQADGQPHIDRGLTLFTGAPHTINCVSTVGEQRACDTVHCSDFNDTSSSYVLMQSIVAIGGFLQATISAIDAAQANATWKQANFTDIFTPKDTDQTTEILKEIIPSLLGTAVGLIPVVGSVLSPLVDIGTSIGSEIISSKSEDSFSWSNASAQGLDSIKNNIANYAVTLFESGDVGKGDYATNLTNLMQGGHALGLPNPPSSDVWQQAYQKIVTSKLAYASWQTWQSEEIQQIPFITFAPGSCGSLDYNDASKVPFISAGLDQMDSRFDYNGSCYWLLTMVPNQEDFSCSQIATLPGGTNKQLADVGDGFGGLELADFIIPSVEGWIQNNRANGYPQTSPLKSAGGNIRTPGSLNITVCDYLAGPHDPGVGCPLYLSGNTQSSVCATQEPNALPSNAIDLLPGGTWAPGVCKINMTQYAKKDDGNPADTDDGINPWPMDYQLSVAVYDNDDRIIGNGAKNFVAGVLQVWNTALPYEIFIHVSSGSGNDPIEFWYSDQHWNTETIRPDPLKNWEYPWDNENRHIATLFDCPAPAGTPPESATKATPLPTDLKLQPVIPFGDPVTNTFTGSGYEARPTWPAQPPTSFSYTPGSDCIVEVIQYAKNYDGVTSGQFQYEAYIWDSVKQPISPELSAQVLASPSQENVIQGLKDKFTVSFDDDTTQPMHYKYGDDTWDSNQYGASAHSCSYDNWDGNGHQRISHCHFSCH